MIAVIVIVATASLIVGALSVMLLRADDLSLAGMFLAIAASLGALFCIVYLLTALPRRPR